VCLPVVVVIVIGRAERGNVGGAVAIAKRRTRLGVRRMHTGCDGLVVEADDKQREDDTNNLWTHIRENVLRISVRYESG